MIAILRFAPGERAQIAGRYALVGHYGEVTDHTIEVNEGELFPLYPVSTELGMVWWVQIPEPLTIERAA